MATEVLMPKQGNTVESCIILEWKKQTGDTVSAGDTLCEVETDKATFEVEAPADGVLLGTFFKEDDDVPVLTPIAAIGEAGEEIPEEIRSAAAGAGGGAAGEASDGGAAAGTAEPAGAGVATESSAAESESAAGSDGGGGAGAAGGAGPGQSPAATTGPSVGTSGSAPAQDSAAHSGRVPPASPRARHMAAAEGLDLSGLGGSGPGGRIIERDVAAALADRAPMTPAARAEAVKRGVETPSVGTGIGGRVTVEDVQRLAAQGGAAAAAASGADTAAASTAAAGGAPPEAGEPEFPGPATDITVRGVRKLTAERMLHSLQSTAQLTLNSSADARALQSYRKKLKNSDEERGLTAITLNDLILYAVTRVLPRYPELNSHFLGDTIRRFEHVHLGFAVDTERGLMVPTIRFADRLTLKQLAAESRRLATACHEGSIESDELAGATFTVTNLGNLGIESFTPVLNPPQAGILGVSAITPQPAYQGEEVVHIPSISLSLTIDHQAVDGAPGARFLKALAEAIGEFELLLAE